MTEIHVRIDRLLVDQAALGGLSRVAYGERLRAELARAMVEGAAASTDPVAGAIARAIRDTGAAR